MFIFMSQNLSSDFLKAVVNTSAELRRFQTNFLLNNYLRQLERCGVNVIINLS